MNLSDQSHRSSHNPEESEAITACAKSSLSPLGSFTISVLDVRLAAFVGELHNRIVSVGNFYRLAIDEFASIF